MFKLFSITGAGVRFRLPALRCLIAAGACISIGVAAGCATAPAPPPADLSQPGWTTRQGQAVWRPSGHATEVAGDLLVAARADGSSVVHFTKTPLPLVTAEATPDSWRIDFIPARRERSGRGAPPLRLVWFCLPRCLDQPPPPAPWKWETRADNSWTLSNSVTGESLEGYFSP